MKMRKIIMALVLMLMGIVNAWAEDYPSSSQENVKYAWADVLRVDPVYGYARTDYPREECRDVQVEHREGYDNKVGGAVIGAIVGGALGSTVGKGDGRKAATIAGAVIGGTVGHNVAGEGYSRHAETRCRVINGVVEERRIMGYDVQYRYRGDIYASHLDYDPGERVRVRVSVTPAD